MYLVNQIQLGEYFKGIEKVKRISQLDHKEFKCTQSVSSPLIRLCCKQCH